MATNDSHQIEEFIEAINNWELEKLYIDLASTKGKALTPVEKKFLRGLLCGCSPAEIASIVYQSRSSSTVRVYLSNGLYKYIEEMLSIQAGYSVKVKNWSRVTYLLEKAGYKKDRLLPQLINSHQQIHQETGTELVKIQLTSTQDWGEAIDVSMFYGRAAELTKVQQWIIQEHCRLIALLGMSGTGKTAFSIKLAQEVQEHFDYIIWRSLLLAPTPEGILDQIIAFLSPHIESKVTETVETKISRLIDCLRSARCLIILDHLDSILANDHQHTQATTVGIKNIPNPNILSQIKYNSSYEIYQELIRRVGESQHQSCLIFTSREKTPEITLLEGDRLPVRSLQLTGLTRQDSRLILQDKGLSQIAETELQVLFNWYGGNPLFLKLVANTIQELFSGQIAEFIAQGTVIFGDIRNILNQQFHRLSHLEKQIIYWITSNQNSVGVNQLPASIIPGLSPRISQRLILEAIELLQKRSLITKQSSGFKPNPALQEYIIDCLIEENWLLSAEQKGNLLMSQTIVSANLNNHTREHHEKLEI
ncbi:NB-ARC domain-containing protein [Nostoc sp. TCL26-01]|uniref:NB-ARC domain-containing protein n=1 Tax=Nostoc sp. TCL26-01 TaxID=2576904 RepID=UPI0015C17798|nr:NB-ARC domain-containing protein [Nostoc sp. TCL26-01]QLE57790.1 NACHT domain-containing protein [Nostoc sp. TCL26-01]